jgi:lipoate-protein ligase B
LAARLGRVDYQTWQAMIDFTAARTTRRRRTVVSASTRRCYTLGQAGKPEHLLAITASRW